MQKILRYLFIGVLFPLLVQYVFYFQFTSNYTQDLFSEKSFTKFYGSQVYKSRQLGKQIHLWVYHRLASWDKMKNYGSNSYNRERLLHLDKNADVVFYLTYFFIAAFFSVLTSLLTLYLFDDKNLFPLTQNLKDLLVYFLVLLIGFTQFVVTPYDAIGYFFEALGMLLFLKYLRTKNLLLYIGLLITIVLATVNRETSLIILSFMTAIYFSQNGLKKDWIQQMILPVLCFAIPYLILKLLPGEESSFTNESQFSINFNITNPYSLMGLSFAAFVIYFMWNLSVANRRLIKSFLFFSLPYIIIILIVGLLLEYRLWMPLLQGALVLAFLELPVRKNDGKFQTVST